MGLLLTFPSRYWCTIGLLLVFSLTSWSTHVPAGCLTRRTLDPTRTAWPYPYGAVTLSGRPSQASRMSQARIMSWSEPHPKVVWAAPLSLAATDGIDAIFLFLGVLRCFNSPRVPPKGVRPSVARCCPCRVSPFRDPRIEAHFQLPEAYRR